jgi:hypothetical protein
MNELGAHPVSRKIFYQHYQNSSGAARPVSSSETHRLHAQKINLFKNVMTTRRYIGNDR